MLNSSLHSSLSSLVFMENFRLIRLDDEIKYTSEQKPVDDASSVKVAATNVVKTSRHVAGNDGRVIDD